MAGKKRGRPSNNVAANVKKSPEEIKKENIKQINAELKAQKEIQAKAEQEVAVLKARLIIEELDEKAKTELLKKQDRVINFIRCISTLDKINDALDKLGIEIEESCEETAEEITEPLSDEPIETFEENS